MVWTKEDEEDFMAMVRRRRERGIPFNPFGRGHKPPTDAELTASLPLSLRLQWARDDLKTRLQAGSQPAQPPETAPETDEPHSPSQPESRPSPHHQEPDPDA